ncbi:Piso0_002090 [Millerozyma farinosa CBS 7064]|uniref:Piso0_002090 protein n=1 Tax=Pichia sorbitophila (strain ATCC MYA-4447 / BCRC 22081 / CBS 7064 / NBRC 10061 / NRRL Y-12695) TaxID=559304 RepID=G8YBN6_PICSO|nr:Piso0_002090 [Millerozyma farinosa CBS 7064]
MKEGADHRQKSKRACLRCKNRKTKCSGETTCRSCVLANAECIYVEKGKRVSILASKLWGMKDQIHLLEKRLEEYQGRKSAEEYGMDIIEEKTSIEYAASPDVPVTNTKEKKESSLESGSSDMLIHKMAEMQHIKLSNKGIDSSKSNLKLPPKRNIPREDGINSVTLEEAEKLVEFVHFYLSSVNLPFEFEYIVKKLRDFHSRGHWKFPDDEYWKPLIYLLLALGQHYQGIRTDIVDNDDSSEKGAGTGTFPFFSVGLSDIFPLNSFQNEKVVIILVLAAYYFRSVNNDLDAILYSSIAMDVSIQLNLHINPSKGAYSDEEVEFRSRIFWTAYTTNRFLSAKLGHPISYDTSEITANYPKMLYFEGNECSSIKFPNSEDLKYYIELSKIAEEIVTVIYKKKSNTYTSSAGSGKLLESVHRIILKLIRWNESLPSNFRLRLNESNWKYKKDNRLKCSIHLNYCYQVHLATVAVLFQLFHEKTRAQQESQIFNLSDLSLDKSTMLTICVNAAQLSTNILVTLLGNSSIAVFGVVDIDYVHSAALTFSLANFLGINEVNDIQKPFNSCLSILKQLSEKGNQNATDKYQKIKLFVEGLNKKNRKNSKIVSTKNKVQGSFKSLQSLPEHMLRESYKNMSREITDPLGPIDTKPLGETPSFPSQILDTSFLPTSYEEFVDGESNFLNGENGEFWEHAYSNVHLWTSMNQWDYIE